VFVLYALVWFYNSVYRIHDPAHRIVSRVHEEA